MSFLTLVKKATIQNSIVLASLLALPITVNAIESTTSSKSISYSVTKETTDIAKSSQLKAAKKITLMPLLKEGYRSETGSSENTLQSTSYVHEGEFTIYDASSNLISDFDYDGFYHRFSVTIDADTVYSSAYVYAEIYLSYEGGPWNYTASSDNYTLYGTSPHDAFTIETELTEGFPAGHYDIRIELYDADFNEWLVTSGPYENYSLSALPLEDSHYDKDTIDVVHTIETDIYVSGHGGMDLWMFGIIGLLVLARMFSRQQAVKQ